MLFIHVPQTRHTHAHHLTCARLHKMDRRMGYTACVICRQQPPPSPLPPPNMYPSHPHQGPARAEGATCTLGMAAGTTVGFLLPSHSSLTLSLLKTLLPLRETHLHMCSSSSSSSLTKTLLVLVGDHCHLAASQTMNTCSCSSSTRWLSSSQSMRADPGSKGGCQGSSRCRPLSSSLYTLVASRLWLMGSRYQMKGSTCSLKGNVRRAGLAGRQQSLQGTRR